MQASSATRLPPAKTLRRSRRSGNIGSSTRASIITNRPVASTATVAAATGTKRLPVVDEEGLLVGIVSRADLLKVFARPDHAIRREIMDEIIVGEFMMDPSRFFIHVNDGVVVLQGRCERRSMIPFLLRAVHGVEGVVRVEDRLGCDIDDRDRGMAMAYPWLRP